MPSASFKLIVHLVILLSLIQIQLSRKQTDVLNINNKNINTKMGDLPLFLRLILCSCATLGLTIGEFLVSNYTHSITLLGAFYLHL